MAPFPRDLLLGLTTDEGLLRLVEQGAPWARAFARVLPAATLVPSLSTRGSPGALRFAIAAALAAPLAPALPWHPGTDPTLPLQLLLDVLHGLPLALVVATPLWVATHVGAIADLLRGAPEANVAPPPAADGARGPLATLTALLAAAAWLSTGGALRALTLLSRAAPDAHAPIAPFALAARALTDGLRLGVALSAGVLVAATTLEVALAAIGRVAAPISPQPLAMLARPLVAVLALALSIEAALSVLVR